MKTTIEISDPLFEAARKLAAKEHTSMRNLVEQGLRHVISEYKSDEPFHLRKASYKGKGLRPELHDTGWDALRELAYEDRGA